MQFIIFEVKIFYFPNVKTFFKIFHTPSHLKWGEIYPAKSQNKWVFLSKKGGKIHWNILPSQVSRLSLNIALFVSTMEYGGIWKFLLKVAGRFNITDLFFKNLEYRNISYCNYLLLRTKLVCEVHLYVSISVVHILRGT